MTQFPFDSAHAPTEVAADESAEPGNRRAAVLLGGGLVLAAGAAAFLLLGGSGDGTAELVPISAVAKPAKAAPLAAAVPAAPVTQVLPAEHTEDIARNPFEAKYVEPPPPPPPAPAAPAAPPGALVPVTPAYPLPLPLEVGSGSGTGAGAPGTTGTVGTTTPVTVQPGPAEPAPSVEYPITLVAVGDPAPEVRVLTWKVDGEEVEVIPGQRFGRFGELVVLAYTTKQGTTEVTGALVQVGDASPLTVSIGETVKVQ